MLCFVAVTGRLNCSVGFITQILGNSSSRTEHRSLRTKTYFHDISTVDRSKDSKIVSHLPRRHRSSRSAKMAIRNMHPLIVASFNARSVKGIDMICKRYETSTLLKIMTLTSLAMTPPLSTPLAPDNFRQIHMWRFRGFPMGSPPKCSNYDGV